MELTASTPITGLAELDAHLDDLVQDPALALNPKLFDHVELQLTGMPTAAKTRIQESSIKLNNTHQRPTYHP